MPPLDNPRHERFAQELAKGKSASEAYVEAGYKENQARSAASRLLSTNVSIGQRVAQIQARASDRVEVTLSSLMAELEEARELAISLDQPSAAVSAIKEKAILAGIRVEKSERKNVNDARELTDNELEAAIADAAAREAAETANKAQLN